MEIFSLCIMDSRIAENIDAVFKMKPEATTTDTMKQVSYDEIEAVRNESIKYFSQDALIANKIRFRHPNSEKYILPATNRQIKKGLSPLKQTITLEYLDYTEGSTTAKRCSELQKIGCLISLKNYEEALKVCKEVVNSFMAKNIDTPPILCFYGFFLSIMTGDDSGEFYFFRIIEQHYYFPHEIPIYYRLLDEFKLLLHNYTYLPLFELLFGNLDEFRSIKHLKDHLIPHIDSSHTKISKIMDKNAANATLAKSVSNNFKDESNVFARYLDARNNLPYPKIIGEGYSLYDLMKNFEKNVKNGKGPKRKQNQNKNRQRATNTKATNTNDVVTLLSQGVYAKAVVYANEYLSKNPNDHEMFLHRAFGLMNCGKFADALESCTQSIKIKPTEKGRQMRASLWLMFGDKVLSKEDLDLLENKSVQAIQPKDKNPKILINTD